MKIISIFFTQADDNKEVLRLTLGLAEKAAFLDPKNADYVCEVAHECVQLGWISEARRHFRNATKLDETSLSGLTGLLHCGILENESGLDEQLDSLEEFHKATGMSTVRRVSLLIMGADNDEVQEWP